MLIPERLKASQPVVADMLRKEVDHVKDARVLTPVAGIEVSSGPTRAVSVQMYSDAGRRRRLASIVDSAGDRRFGGIAL